MRMPPFVLPSIENVPPLPRSCTVSWPATEYRVIWGSLPKATSARPTSGAPGPVGTKHFQTRFGDALARRVKILPAGTQRVLLLDVQAGRVVGLVRARNRAVHNDDRKM